MLVRLEEGIADGIRSTVALPIRADGAPIAVIVLVSRTPREPEAGLTRLLEAIGGQVTQFLQRREAEGQAAAQAADLRTPVRASRTSWRARTTCSPRATRSVARSATSRPSRVVALLEPSGTDALAVSAAIGAAVPRSRRRARPAFDHRRGVPQPAS